ncbi:MAG: redoxin domain-containing protein [Actinomycetota bacterium]
MAHIALGEVAPSIPGRDFSEGPTGIFFYKVTCPVCEMTAPIASRLAEAVPGTMIGIGQDPPEALATFADQAGLVLSVPPVQDSPPYPLSDAYGIESVPTLVLVDTSGVVDEVVRSWDRDGYNRAAVRLAELAGSVPVVLSTPDDRLPAFRPG